MWDFKVYFRDGNQRIFSAENIYQVVNHVCFVLNYDAEDIIKVEEV